MLPNPSLLQVYSALAPSPSKTVSLFYSAIVANSRFSINCPRVPLSLALPGIVVHITVVLQEGAINK